MAIRPAVLDALVAAGATIEMIVAAVKADQTAKSGAHRQSEYRARQKAAKELALETAETGTTDLPAGGVTTVRRDDGDATRVTLRNSDVCDENNVTPVTPASPSPAVLIGEELYIPPSDTTYPRPPNLEADLEKPKPSSAKGTRLTESWVPSEKSRQFGAERLTPRQVTDEFMKFRNHWLSKAGADARKTNWDRTWENWVLRAAEQQQPRSRGSPPHRMNGKDSLLQVIGEAMEKANERDRSGDFEKTIDGTYSAQPES